MWRRGGGGCHPLTGIRMRSLLRDGGEEEEGGGLDFERGGIRILHRGIRTCLCVIGYEAVIQVYLAK